MYPATVLLATDVPVVVLSVSVVVLLGCTALLSWTLPAIDWRWWRRSRPRRARAARRRHGRRVVTGPPPALPTGPLPTAASPLVPPRHPVGRQDVPKRDDVTSEAEAMIDVLLDTDPDRLANLMTQWIREDHRRDTAS